MANKNAVLLPSTLVEPMLIVLALGNLALNYCGRPSWYLGFFIIAWGLVSTVTSQVQNFAGILVCRLVLGFTEAPFFPG